MLNCERRAQRNAQSKVYRDQNKEKIARQRVERDRAYRQKLKENPNWKCAIQTLVRSARSRAKAKGLEFTLDQRWIAATVRGAQAAPICAVSGATLELGKGRYRAHLHSASPSLDRIELHRGYVPDNVRLVAWWVNKAKGVQTDAAFEEWVLLTAQAIRAKRRKERLN